MIWLDAHRRKDLSSNYNQLQNNLSGVVSSRRNKLWQNPDGAAVAR
jgi:hypothetical protein